MQGSNICAENALRSALAVGARSDWDRRQVEFLAQAVGELISIEDAPSALQALRESSPRLLILFGRSSCLDETLQFVLGARAVSPEVPLVVLAQHARADHAVQLGRAGARDYIAGPLNEEMLARLLEAAGAEETSGSGDDGRFFCSECPPGVRIVGRSPAIVRCLENIRLLAESWSDPALIVGETGSGKELAARALHLRRYGDFERLVAVNCATLTANLLESELFGHVKGAFTGADRDKSGLFEQASGGSIFLDEISEMAPQLQAKLLRVLQERTFRKVGGTKDIPCNASVVASSNKDLLAEVEKGKFRKDLYYRLAIFPVLVPPLRDENRLSDVPLLGEYFLESASARNGGRRLRLSREAQRRLAEHNWPGNVRELRNVIERAVILAKDDEISACDLIFDHQLSQMQQQRPAEPNRRSFSLEAAEREFILRALKETGWQRTRAAALLGITRATLHAKLKRYQIKPPDKRERSAAAAAAGDS